MSVLENLAQAIIAGDAMAAKSLTEAALQEGATPSTVIKEGLIAGMDVISRRFKAREIFVPEVLIAARAMHSGLDVLKPLLASSGQKAAGQVVMGSAKGDLHDIGKNLVIMMLEGAGFEVTDLGVDVAPERFVQAVQEQKPHAIGISSLLTTTMPAMGKTIEALAAANVRDQVKVVIGGAPVTQRYADEIGADGYAPDASAAVELIKNLVG
ncbi:MAG TPA: cobalamin-binding protein [Firmicutes bacterium]|jgi:5-methyltetrahydrofolate--homocysteine methyltransferase|nr:cobalamin-binding protein [Bacillota bacterium]